MRSKSSRSNVSIARWHATKTPMEGDGQHQVFSGGYTARRMPKTMTLRLSDELAADLEAMARVDDVPVSEAIRVAIDERIKGRRDDKQFQARLRR